MALMKQAEFSVRHGVSRKTVTQWKKRGWLVFEGDLVDVVASDAMIAKYRRDGVPQADAAVTQKLPTLLPRPKVTTRVTRQVTARVTA